MINQRLVANLDYDNINDLTWRANALVCVEIEIPMNFVSILGLNYKDHYSYYSYHKY